MIPQEIKEFVNEITSKAFAVGFSVDIIFSGADVSVHLYPVPKISTDTPAEEPEKVEVYDD